MEQRNEPTTAEIVKALREADEYSGMPGYCGTVEDIAAHRLEQLERELVRITNELTAMTARAEKAEAETKRTIQEIETYYDCEDFCNVCLCGNESRCKHASPFFGCGFTYDRRGLRGKGNDGKD